MDKTWSYELQNMGSIPIHSIDLFWWYSANLVEQPDCESGVTRFESEVLPYEYGVIDIIGIGLVLKTSGV